MYVTKQHYIKAKENDDPSHKNFNNLDSILLQFKSHLIFVNFI